MIPGVLSAVVILVWAELVRRARANRPGPGRVPVSEYTDRYAIEADRLVAEAAREQIRAAQMSQIASGAIAMDHMDAFNRRRERDIIEPALRDLPTAADVTAWYEQNAARTPWGTPQIGRGQ